MPAPETPLENTEHLARDARTLAGEKEIAELEAAMSGDARFSGEFKTKLDTLRDGTLTLAKSFIATVPISEQREVAFTKLRQFFEVCKEAIAAKG